MSSSLREREPRIPEPRTLSTSKASRHRSLGRCIQIWDWILYSLHAEDYLRLHFMCLLCIIDHASTIYHMTCVHVCVCILYNMYVYMRQHALCKIQCIASYRNVTCYDISNLVLGWKPRVKRGCSLICHSAIQVSQTMSYSTTQLHTTRSHS